MRLSGTKTNSIHQYRGLGDQLWDLGGARPSLDLQFSATKNLIDSVSGQSLVTFTRASSGTYVGSDGVLKTATTNLLQRSEEFDNAYWTKGGSTISANSATAPNGLTTADKLVEDTSTGNHRLFVATTSLAASTAHSLSVYVKAAGRTFIRVEVRDSVGAFAAQDFNLTTLAITTAGSGTGTISSLGNGWYRCTVTGTSSASGGLGTALFWALSAPSGTSYTGDGTSGLLLWGAQLEQSSTVGEYIPTTSTINSAPRFDHNPTTGESLGLLVEEQRTNLVTTSATFQPSSAGNPASYTVDQVAPDGTTTASRQTATNPRTFVDYQGIANAQYTFSVYAKAASGTVTITLQLKNAASDTVIATGSNVTLTTAWQRLTVTGTTNGATTGARIEVIGSVVGAPAGTVFWGAQLEAGAFPTSYIPTTAATATRSADVASITGANFSSWYRQDEGTVFADVSVFSASKTNQVISFNDGTSNNRWEARPTGIADVLRATCTVGNVLQFDTNLALTGLRRILAMSIKPGDSRIQSGASGATLASFAAMPVVDRLYLNYATFANGEINGTIRRLTYWPARLANSTLQQITQ